MKTKATIIFILLLHSIASAAPYTISTVFDVNEIWNVQYAQTANIMYLVDGTDPPQKLTRAGHADWTIEDANIITGPFQTENILDISITPNGTTGTITLIADSNIWDGNHVGGLWEINQKRGTSAYKGTLTGDGNSTQTAYFTGGYSFTTSGIWDATVTLERSTDSGSSWDAALVPLNSTNFDNPAEYEEDGAIYRVLMSDFVSGSCKYNFMIADLLNHGIVRIATWVDANEVTATVLTDLENTDSTKKWREGYWSDYRGWPKTVEFHQQRLVFGGSDSFPQTLWFGEANPDDYEDFAEGTLDTSSFTAALVGQNPIRWLKSQDYLIIGTSGSIGKYGSQGQPITLTSPNYQEQSRIGSASIMSVLAGDALLYIERGDRKIREFSYALASDKYRSTELTILAEDITESGIKDVAFQTRPEPILWCVLNDGNIATLTYRRDQLSQSSPIEIVGWAKQTTDGDFESVARIPGTGTNEKEDEIWVVVKRTIDGNDVRYIEQFQPRDWGTDQNDCWFVDSGLSYDGNDTNDFNGLDHLIYENVYVYGDGVIEPNEIVDANGGVIIDRVAGRVLMGLPFTSRFETLPIQIDPRDKAMNKKISSLDFDFLKTGACQYGSGSDSELENINFENDMNFDVNAVTQPFWTSEIDFKHVNWPYGSLKKQTIYCETDKPVPLTIRAIGLEFRIYP